jgi:hypothetical protein
MEPTAKIQQTLQVTVKKTDTASIERWNQG